MRKLFTLLVTLLITVSVFSQAPQKMSYQAVIRNSSNVLLANTRVGMKISILQNTTPVYVEMHTATTNANGLVTIEIGEGTILSGVFISIDWSAGTYFIKTETDPSGGTNYSIVGTSEFLSVPYALLSATVTTNANLTGIVTSTGNVTAIANNMITNAMLTNSAVANLSGANTGDQNLSGLKLKSDSLIGSGYFTNYDAIGKQNRFILNVKDLGAIGDGVTEDSTYFKKAIDSLNTLKGGILFIPTGVYKISSQLKIPVNRTKQYPIKIIGSGASVSGQSTGVNGGTVLDMRYSGNYGKLLTIGLGSLSISDVTFLDKSGDSTAFIYSTYTTLFIHNNTFLGSKYGINCNQDAIILGGTTENENTITVSPTYGFQGYGTVIEKNFCDSIRRFVYGRTFANAVIVQNNNIWKGCGSNLSKGAAIEFDNPAISPEQYDAGEVITGNLIECVNYKYAINIGRVTSSTIIGNNCYDPGINSIAGVYFGTHATNNYLVSGFASPMLAYIDESVNKNNVVIDPLNGYTISTKDNIGLHFNPPNAAHSYKMFAGYPAQYDGSLQIKQDINYIGGISADGFLQWGGTPSSPRTYMDLSGNFKFLNNSASGNTNITLGLIGARTAIDGNITNASFANIRFVTNPTTWYKGEMVFETNNIDGTDGNYPPTEKMRIKSNGDVNVNYNLTALSLIKYGGLANQFLKADGSVDANSYAVREVADEFIATASETAFNLLHIPSANSIVKMYINGVRISNKAYSLSSTTLTYNPANNGLYALVAGDRIQFDYYY